jgi:monofunctional biosynthetic peptidoglycan transglycosylase
MDARVGRASTKSPRFAAWVVAWVVLSTLLGLGLGTAAQVAALRHAPPSTTAFQRRALARQGPPLVKRWRPLAAIDPQLVRAVLVAEDSRFFQHDGFDRTEMKASLRDAALRFEPPRGASTLTQQLAKNLYLSPERSWIRKGLEAGATVLLEALLPKRRILELYLNEVEFGPGVFGVEAGAQHHFGRSSAELTEPQAAQLAAVLPAPHRWSPATSSPRYLARVTRIQRRMRRAPHLDRELARIGTDRTEPATDGSR